MFQHGNSAHNEISENHAFLFWRELAELKLIY